MIKRKHYCQWMKRLCLNGGAVAEQEDGEQSLQYDSVFQF
jgi:hypothetical protein